MTQIMGRREVLQASEVLQFAKDNSNSAIRAEYDRRQLFDDSVAAEVARLAFARHLIQRIRVKIVQPDHPPIVVRTFVNLVDERTTADRGYRIRAEVLSSEQRQEMLRRDFATAINSLVARFHGILNAEQVEALQDIAADVTTQLV